jgi:hypothetical protein
MLYTYKYMKRVVGPAGYTIVETMIFLAVSAVLFVSASVLIAGRQRRTQFATTVREFSSKIQSVYGSVSSGYYNTTGSATCTLGAGKTKINTLKSGGGAQGTNGDCMYLGKVIVSPQPNSSDFRIISLVGLRRATSPLPHEVQNLTEADPTLYTDPEAIDTYRLAGADFISVKADGALYSGIATSVAFIGSLASYNIANMLKSGAGYTSIYTVPSDDISRGGTIESTLAGTSGTLSTPHTISYCLSNGQQYAQVKLEGGTASYVIGENSTICS